ncbi:MAG TPA: Uma2 family endonuclease, partial [Kamptonema sp.]|nr:Uma2 family endonuclease [Kamptonema sp.]
MNSLVLEKPIIESNQCLTLSNVSWEKFEEIKAALDGIPGVRLVYLDGTLDITTPLSEEHEEGKT